MLLPEAAREIREFLVRLADRMAVHFPLHADALRGEVIGERLTTERWSRITALLASLSSVPGAPLSAEEHRSRAFALRAVAVAQKMSAAHVGLFRDDPEYLADFAVYMAREIAGDFSGNPSKAETE